MRQSYMVSTCYDVCSEPDHLVDSDSEVGRMVYIRERVMKYPASGCWKWCGDFRKGEPVFPWYTRADKRKTYHQVRKFNYYVEYMLPDEEYPATYTTENLCGNDKCVAPAHTRLITAEEPITESIGYIAMARKIFFPNRR